MGDTAFSGAIPTQIGPSTSGLDSRSQILTFEFIVVYAFLSACPSGFEFLYFDHYLFNIYFP